MSPLVDALVVHYLRPDLTRRAVAAVAAPGTTARVWDNSGDLGSEPVTGADEVLGDGTNRLFAAGNNALYARGHAPYVLLLNPDVEITPTAVAELVAVLEAHPEAWGAAPRLVGPDGADQRYVKRLPTTAGLLADRLPPLRLPLRRAFEHYRCTSVDLQADLALEQPPAAALLLRRDRVDAAGGLFDEAYPLFFNDVDLARRLLPGGPCRYAGGTTALHVGGASLRAAGRRGDPIGALYDEAVVRYARRHLRHAWTVQLAVRVRAIVDRVRGGWWR